MTKPLVFNYKNHEELRQAYKELLADNQQLIADNRKLRQEVTELKQLNDGYVKIIAKNQETNNKLMASVQKQTGGDYISRADAIEAVRKCKVQDIRFGNVTSNMMLVQKGEVIVALSTLPSADAVQGEWIDIDNYYRLATCSHCNKVTMFEKWGEHTKPYNFCPNCGARMTPYKGGDDE